MKKFIAALATSVLMLSAAVAQTLPPPTIAAKSWLLLDATSGQIIASQDPNLRIEPASLTKIMTAYVTFAALRDKKILSAGLDVFEDEPNVPQELIAMDHVVLFPHVGSASVHCRNLMGQLVVDNLVSWNAGKGPLTPVNETPWPPKKK